MERATGLEAARLWWSVTAARPIVSNAKRIRYRAKNEVCVGNGREQDEDDFIELFQEFRSGRERQPGFLHQLSG